jgi:hypothetical protein
MKDFLKKHWLAITIFGSIGLIIIPLCINLFFKISAPADFLVSEWTAGDALTFYGVLLGAGLAVWGVFLSIQYAQRNYREDVRNRVLPFFAIDLMAVKAKRSGGLDMLFPQNIEISPENEPTNYYREFSIDDFYFTIKDGKVVVNANWTKEQADVIHSLGTRALPNGQNSWAVVNVEYINLPIKVRNIGLGSAIHFQVGLNPKGSIDCYTKMFPVLPEQEITLHIYIDGLSGSNIGNYELVFRYGDIYENYYEQAYPLAVKELEKDGQMVVGCEIDQSGFQKQITEDKHNG